MRSLGAERTPSLDLRDQCISSSNSRQWRNQLKFLCDLLIRKYKQIGVKLKAARIEKESQIYELQKTLSKVTENEAKRHERQEKKQVRVFHFTESFTLQRLCYFCKKCFNVFCCLQLFSATSSVEDKSYCVAHRHREIIENQKEALLELRAKVRVLEEQVKKGTGAFLWQIFFAWWFPCCALTSSWDSWNQPSNLTHWSALTVVLFIAGFLVTDDASAELTKVRRELAELRAKDKLRSEVHSARSRSIESSHSSLSTSEPRYATSGDDAVSVFSFLFCCSDVFKSGTHMFFNSKWFACQACIKYCCCSTPPSSGRWQKRWTWRKFPGPETDRAHKQRNSSPTALFCWRTESAGRKSCSLDTRMTSANSG